MGGMGAPAAFPQIPALGPEAALGAPELYGTMTRLLAKLDECIQVERERRDTEVKMWKEHEQHAQRQIGILKDQVEEDQSQISILRQLLAEQNHSMVALLAQQQQEQEEQDGGGI
jgi:hypothetical protein